MKMHVFLDLYQTYKLKKYPSLQFEKKCIKSSS